MARRAAKEGHPVVIVYPGLLYGPGRISPSNIVSRLVSSICAFRIFKFQIMGSSGIDDLKLREKGLLLLFFH